MTNLDNNKYRSFLAKVLGIGLSLFHLYTGFFGLLFGMYQRAIHFSIILAICFVLFPATKNERLKKYTNIADIFLIILSILIGIYIIVEYSDIVLRLGSETQMDILLGIVAICLTLEATRRTCGLPIVILAAIFILYALMGKHLPLLLMHKGYSIQRIASFVYLTTDGIFSTPLGVAASFIILFVIFSELLKACGAGDYFINLAYSATGWARGGPAKSAVLASAFFGTISGSAMANVVATGTFTIPLMIHNGYKPEFAAAVEATASTGGMILPPIMGAAAFIMAEMLNVPYISICIIAIIPAILYYVSIFFTLDLEAQKLNLKGMPRKEFSGFKDVLFSGFEFFIPLLTLIYFLVKQWSPASAVSYAIFALIVVSFFRKKNRFTIKTFLIALSNGTKNTIPVTSACATAGILSGIVILTGLGLGFSSVILGFAKGVLFYGLVLTMIASIILGMGLPSSACYIILSVLAAPALIRMGVDKFAAHLFILYFGTLSNITPPVALAAYAAAGLAGTNSTKVAIQSVKLALVAFVVPYMFVYDSALLFVGKPLLIIRTFASALIGCYAVAVAVSGWFYGPRNYVERIIWLLCGLGLIYPGLVSDIVCISMLLAIGGFDIYRYKNKNPDLL